MKLRLVCISRGKERLVVLKKGRDVPATAGAWSCYCRRDAVSRLSTLDLYPFVAQGKTQMAMGYPIASIVVD